MGCGMSTEEKEGKLRNEEIENQLKRDKMLQRNEIKMLLLGMSSPLFVPALPFQCAWRPASFVLCLLSCRTLLTTIPYRSW
jgi:hypothetical protein